MCPWSVAVHGKAKQGWALLGNDQAGQPERAVLRGHVDCNQPTEAIAL